ncbi:MAG: ribonuclease P protein component [Acidobacteria bacterium]|nr:MAG: ribonuclease P protein component [Acidobacteriota bacterium]
MRPHAFPKNLRLLRRSEFRKVYEKGQRRSAPLCSVFFLPNGMRVSRLGITASGRLGGAVVRNRVKRRLREVFRLNRANIPGGWDVVLNPREAVAKVPFLKLTEQVLKLFPAAPPPAGTSPRGGRLGGEGAKP